MTTVAILGLGASGEAAARLALHNGANCYVSDLRTDASTAARAARIQALGAHVELGQHDVERLAGADAVVVSPGIPPDAPVLVQLRDRGVRWISEPEFAVRFLHGSLIGITETNGKTTTSVLVHHLLKEAGVRAALGGNLGGGLAPAASELPIADPDADWVVLELSSFQLADIDTLRPDIGVVTGLAPDHLDRYPSVEAYYGDKARLFENGTAESIWVLNGELPEVEALAGQAPGRRYRFAMEEAGGIHAFVRDDALILSVEGGEETLISRAELPMLGRHNVMNALAAGLVARLAGAPPEAIARGLASARPLANRLEPVAEADGVLWVNDSKATNVAATVSALLSMDRPVVLLLGGKDKGEELGPLVAAAGGVAQGGVAEGGAEADGIRPGGVRVALCYGEAGPRILEALRASGVESEGCAGGLRGAVARARERASEGDVILLSPACSSFDEFENYEARGRAFSEMAREVAA